MVRINNWTKAATLVMDLEEVVKGMEIRKPVRFFGTIVTDHAANPYLFMRTVMYRIWHMLLKTDPRLCCVENPVYHEHGLGYDIIFDRFDATKPNRHLSSTEYTDEFVELVFKRIRGFKPVELTIDEMIATVPPEVVFWQLFWFLEFILDQDTKIW